jgi:hypothetical protein
VPLREPEDQNMDRDQREDHPRAFVSLRHHHHDEDEAGDDRAEAVDERAHRPPGSAQTAPVHDHTGLRQRKRHEDADHVKRNERVRVAAVGHEQEAREYTQSHDSVRERQPIALIHQLAREIPVARENRCQPGEVRIRGVCREY